MSVLFLLLLLGHLSAAAAQDASLAVGTRLATNQTITSTARTFALGFFTSANSTHRRFYLAVWYNNIPGQVVVWIANRDAPLTDPSGGATISADGNLVVVDGNSTPVWSTGLVAAQEPTRASLDDSGNLALRNRAGIIVWQSFDFPTDTLLPRMNLRLNRTTGRVRGLVSWRSSTDPSTGEDYFGLDPVWPVQFIIARGAVRRWRSALFSNRIFSEVTTFYGDRSFAMYLTVTTSAQEMIAPLLLRC